MRRVVGLRRARAKRPHQQRKQTKILKLYAKKANCSRWLHVGTSDDNIYPEPASHPTRGSAKPWKSVVQVEGPVGLLIQSVYSIGSKTDRAFNIRQDTEAHISIVETPYQHLPLLVAEAAARARTKAAADTKSINKNLHEIDKEVTMKGTKVMSKEGRAMLRTSHSEGGQAKVKLHETGHATSSRCDDCGHQYCDLDHLLWDCEFFRSTREEADKELADVPSILLCKPLRRGLAPAMKCKHDGNYWGLDIDKVEGVSTHIKKPLGQRQELHVEVYRELEDAGEKGLDARQKMAQIKGAYGGGQDPTFPIEVSGQVPEAPNAYSDGGLMCPSEQWWSIGGYGLWWPGHSDDEQYRQQVINQQFTHQDIRDEGIGLWGKLLGQRNSSTRMELAGTIMAMGKAVPLRIASDSQSMIEKAMKLKQAASDWNNDPDAVRWPR